MSNEPLLKVRDLHTSFFTPAGEVRAVNGACGFAHEGEVIDL